MGILRQIAEYLYIKKKDPNENPSQWVKYMHGINRFTLVVFILGILYLLFKMFILPKL
jgi:hypothetical protein